MIQTPTKISFRLFFLCKMPASLERRSCAPLNFASLLLLSISQCAEPCERPENLIPAPGLAYDYIRSFNNLHDINDNTGWTSLYWTPIYSSHQFRNQLQLQLQCFIEIIHFIADTSLSLTHFPGANNVIYKEVKTNHEFTYAIHKT